MVELNSYTHDALQRAVDARVAAALAQLLNPHAEPKVVEPVAAQPETPTASDSLVKLSPDTWLNRRDTAKALTEHSFPTSAETLRTKASKGGGPPYRKWGRIVMYQWGASLAWAKGRLSEPRRSTSETF